MASAVTRQRGVILLVVLWAIALLSLLLLAASASVHGSLALSRSMMREFRGDRLAESAVEIAAGNLLTIDPQRRWIADGRRYLVGLGSDQIGIRVRDGGGLIDVNRAEIGLIRNLLRQFTDDAAAADTISRAIELRRGTLSAASWDPAASVGLRRVNRSGIEPRRPFRSLAELTPVFGADAELLPRVVSYMTIAGRTGAINPAAAPRAVLAAVPDISRQEVEIVLGAHPNGRIMGADAQAIVTKYGRYFDTEGTGVYTVTIEGASARARSATVVLDPRGSAPYHIVSWSW